MSSAICLNLDQSKILSSGNELNQDLDDEIDLLEELPFVTLTIHLCNGLNDKIYVHM